LVGPLTAAAAALAEATANISEALDTLRWAES